jgi:hypothetical protein
MRRSIITGQRQLIRNMKTVVDAVAAQHLDAVMTEALEPLVAETTANARRLRQPGRTPKGGHLDQGVATARFGVKGKYRREHRMGFRRRARRIAHLVEFGTAPHWQPRRGIMHPGARAKPFARPAFDAKKRAVLSAFRQAIAMRLKAAALRRAGTMRPTQALL